jgi:hypothetical protein
LTNERRGTMNNTWLIILGILAVGAAVFLVLPHLLPERAVTPEGPGVVDVAPGEAEPEPPVVTEPEEEAATTETEVSVEPEPTVEEETVPIFGYAIDGTIGTAEYVHNTRIAGVEVYWSNDATYLRVGLVAPGTGFVAIGFDPVRQMEGANFILGYVEDGKAYFRDDFGTEPTVHMADVDRGGVNNIVSSAGAEWTDRTTLEFIIPLDSGDEMDKPLVPGSTYTVLLAYHDLMDGFTTRHSGRGTGEIQLDAAP